MTRQRAGRGERGYALVAAVAAVAAFSYIAFEVLAVNRGAIAGVNAEFSRARLAAAADGGLAIAVQGLAAPRHWPIDGRAQTLDFDGAHLTIVLEDEKGKAPINSFDESDVRDMFAAVGMSGSRLNALVDSFEDWQDDDDTRRPAGAERADYLAQGLRPRNGKFHTVDELAALKGMDPIVFARLKPALTVFPGERGAFDAATASPLALAIMSDDGPGSVAGIERQREMAGERSAIDTSDQQSLVGRPVTVRVVAADGHGGEARRTAIVELTGKAGRPYWVRYVE